MIALIQRVTQAKVEVNGQTVGEIQQGILVFLGIEKTDDKLKAEKLRQKVMNYRIFSDPQGRMNLNLQQIKGQLLIVSQFTLVADTQSGNRPNFSSAAPAQISKELYEYFVGSCLQNGAICQTGWFAADMQVTLVNDGPVTFQLKV